MVSSRFVVGVKVAVQEMPMPLSEEETELRLPLATLRRAFEKPVTGSEKVKVTRDVSPTVRAVSATTMVAVGRWVSLW